MYSGGVDAAERLVESTRVLLWERGYVGTSPRAIQAHAGVGQGSMYHHFDGKAALARAAIERTAAELRAAADAQLGADAPALARVEAYLRRERDVLRGCPVGRLTQDPDVMADAELRRPVEQTFTWLRARLGDVLAEGVAAGELVGLDAAVTAATIVAVLQGGYVLARAAGSGVPFAQAVDGLLALLAAHAAPAGPLGPAD
ncbi:MULTISPECIES: TetR/AcrR family transcriptional regulator [Frankia]|uniref:TetR-family transcriptional regulator n=1 Tax=Frankia alni (strain DSM 45986 / CECT 9034 / ACN14a) TaxID=326424 RepID=Q0RJG5_FRAAA|nr:putative TetR-family transcriptional regulator [Frankia alni ACN14a]